MQTLNQRGLAAALGLTPATICNWTRSGTITAVVREGRILRYDLDQVRQQLAERAKSNATTEQ